MGKVDFLEDILRAYGATAEFWATASTADRDAGRDEAWDELESLIRSLPESEALAVLHRMVDHSDKPTYIFLAEIYTERGKLEAAAEVWEKAQEKAYEALLRRYSDPQDLCWLGYLLLQRCDVDELPLCADHFNLSTMDFGNNDTLVVSHFPFSDAAVQEFSNEPETLRLATRAFGLAWLYYHKHSEKKSDAWHALPALDGLRAAYFHADNLHALQAVIDTFWDWVENWGLGTGLCCDEFVANFRATDAYLLGRLKRDPANRKAAAERLVAKLGDTWQQVGRLRLTCEYLINGEILFGQLDRKGDWSSAVNDLSKAVESTLKQTVGAYADRNPTEPFAGLLRQTIGQSRKEPPRSLSRLSLSTFTNAFADVVSDSTKKAMFVAWIRKWVPEADERWPDELVRQLKELGRPRYRADHAVQPGEPWKVSYGEAERVHALVLGIGQTGLLPALARLHSRLAGNNA